MRPKKNKKGMLFIIPILVAGVLLFIIATKLKPLLFAGSSAIPNSLLKANTAANESLFSADSVIVDDASLSDGSCSSPSISSGSNSGWVTCRTGKDISFTTSVYNGGTKKRLFYGGIMVCKVKCGQSGACSIVDKSCYEKTYSSPKQCSVLIGSSTPCEAGSYSFQLGTYYVYPVATCYLDNTYGCSSPGLTQAPRYVNTAKPLKVNSVR